MPGSGSIPANGKCIVTNFLAGTLCQSSSTVQKDWNPLTSQACRSCLEVWLRPYIMKPLVNLASRPYRNRRLFWISILAAFVVFSALGLKTIHDLSSLDDQIGDLTPRVNALEVQVRDAQKVKETTAALSADQNRALEAATDLINRKAFSWSELLNAIERNIPP